MARAEAGQCAGGIESDEPVSLGAALGGIGEVAHGAGRAEIAPGFENGVLGHRLHPQALDGFFDFSVFDDVLENQFTFASGIASVDDFADVLAFGELEDLLEASLGIGDGVEIEARRNRREHIKFPRQILAIRAGGHAQFDQMADGRSDDRVVVLEPCIAPGAFFIKLSKWFRKGTAEVCHDAGFFCDDKNFSHGISDGKAFEGWMLRTGEQVTRDRNVGNASAFFKNSAHMGDLGCVY